MLAWGTSILLTRTGPVCRVLQIRYIGLSLDVVSSIQESVIPSHRSLALRPMKENLERVIAALEVEAAMIESHA
jgi:hypothetical protein